MHCVLRRAVLGAATSILVTGCIGGDGSTSSSSSSSSSGGTQSSSAQVADSSSQGASSAPGNSSAATSTATSTVVTQSSSEIVTASSAPTQSSSAVAQSSSSDCNPEVPSCTPVCGAMQFCNASCQCENIPTPPDNLARDSSATAIDLNTDDTLVAAVNRDADSVSIFSTATETVTAKISNLRDPRSVVFHPNKTTFFVSHLGGITRVTGANTVSPTAEAALPVCGEPYGIALSPTGKRLFVACLDGSVVLVDTLGASLSVTNTIHLRGAMAASGGTLPQNAAATGISVTNDGQAATGDAIEKVIVPLFYYEPITVAQPTDVDLGGQGVVAILDYNGAILNKIAIDPVPDTGFGTGAFMNQLSSVWTQGGKAYITALGAAPKGPPGPAATNPDAGPPGVAGGQNTFPFLIVLDINAPSTEPVLHNINLLMNAKAAPIRYMSVLSGLAFVPNTNIAYVTSISSDAAVRVRFATDGTLQPEANTGGFGSALNNFITLGKAPSGITIKHVSTGIKGYVVNEVDRSIQVINFSDQATSNTVTSEPQPAAGSADEHRIKGKRFFITSTARWGNNGMVGCLACHPGNGALSDNVTWYFAAGPRQTVAMDADFGKVGDVETGAVDPQNQRAFNWTAIIDEMHDFEGNTRGVSGGIGAIVSDVALAPSSRLTAAANLAASNKVLVRDTSVVKDWDDINTFAQGIRTPNAGPGDMAAIGRGRQLFVDGGCAKCHGGSKWTISRVPYDPTSNMNGLAADRAATIMYTSPNGQNVDTTVIAGDDVAGQPIKRIACVLRKVGTFNDTNPFEVRANMMTKAQGANGFNPPSLMGVRYGSPFLHNGSVKTLTELFATPAMDAHTTAGNPNFLSETEPTRSTEVADLVAFLESIDDSTAAFPTAMSSILCPTNIP